MTDRVLIPLPGLGTLMLEAEAFQAALAAGTEFAAAPSNLAAGAAPEPLLDAEQAAAQLSVNARWLADSARAGIVPHFKLGRFIRFRVSDVAAHCRVEGAPIPNATSLESVGHFPRVVRQ